jgi:hypothetical protein
MQSTHACSAHKPQNCGEGHCSRRSRLELRRADRASGRRFRDLVLIQLERRSRFDTDTAVSHSSYVMMLGRRFAAVVAVLMLCVGNLAVCAGWQATPAARMACCMNGTSCPMHKSESHGTGSKRTISQVQADNCCAAASNRTQSSVAGPTFVLSNPRALQAATRFVLVAVLVFQKWRALLPLPVSPVPKHLLLSVLLV